MSASVEIQKRLDALLGPLALAPLAVRTRRLDPPDRPRRLLFVKFWGLGNLSMLLPVVRAARRRRPAAHIAFLTLEENAPFLAASGAVDEVVAVPRRPTRRALLALARFVAKRRGAFDLVVDAEPFLHLSALVTARLRPAFSVGFRTPGRVRHLGYDAAVPLDPLRHIAHSFVELGRAAALWDGRPPSPRPLTPRFPAARRRIAGLLAAAGLDPRRPLAVLHPGSGDHVLGRRWPAPRFAEVGRRLVEAAGAAVAVTGIAPERTLAARVAAAIGPGAASLAGRLDLAHFVELLARAAVVVTNDSAPSHLAAALDRPVVALFGPNHPGLYGPIGRRARSFHAGLPCSPCITNRNAKTTWCRRALCLDLVEPSFVAAAALAHLRAAHPAEDLAEGAAIRNDAPPASKRGTAVRGTARSGLERSRAPAGGAP